MSENCVIEIFDEIDNDLLKRISAATCDLEDNSEVVLKISSYGGAILDGIAIIDLLKRFHTHAIIVGYACSAAAIIALSCNEISMTENASLMIHSAWSDACDSADPGIKRCNEIQISIINKRCPTYTAEMLDSDVWMSAEEALKLNLIDNIYNNDGVNYAALCTKYAAKLSKIFNLSKPHKEIRLMNEIDVNEVLEEVKEDEEKVEETAPEAEGEAPEEEPQHDLVEVVEKLVERLDDLECRLKALEEPVTTESPEDDNRINNLYNTLCAPKAQVTVACEHTARVIQKVRKGFEQFTKI